MPASPIYRPLEGTDGHWPIINIDNQDRQCTCHRPVGTRGGCGDGRGPCACPAGQTIHQGEVRHAGRIPPRTGTRPPHPLLPSPCPYSEGSGRRPLLPVLVVTIHNRAATLLWKSAGERGTRPGNSVPTSIPSSSRRGRHKKKET